MTIINYFNEDFLYNQSLDKYREDLSYKLKQQKKISVIQSRRKSREEQIESSQILYSEVMSWDVRDFESIIKNQYYFQRGIIHTIVDDREFSWDVGENN